MGKFFKWIFRIVCLVLVSAIALGVVLVISISDSSNINNEKVVSDNKSSMVIINTALQKSAKNVENTDNIDFKLDEEDLEYLFYSIVTSIKFPNEAVKLTGANVDVVDEKYTLQISGQLGAFKTVITSNIDLNETHGNFTITLNSLKLGKVNLLGVGKKLLSFTNDATIEEALHNANIFCDINLENLCITFTKDNIKRMLLTSLNQDHVGELFSVVVDVFLDNSSLLEFNLGTQNLLGFTLHLASLKTTRQVQYTYNHEDVKEKCESLLKNKTITLEQVNVVFNYLVNGYEDLEDENKQIIDEIDFSSIGIDNKSTYSGIMYHSEKDLADYINDGTNFTLSDVLLNGKFDLLISDDNLNNILQSTLPFIGFSYAFANDETNEIGYLVIEQFNIKCIENKLQIDLISTINTVKVYIEIIIDCNEENDGLSVTGSINNIRLGSNELSASQKDDLLKYLEYAFYSVDWMKFNASENKVVLDFSKAVSENEIIQLIVSSVLNAKYSTKILDDYVSIQYKVI